MSFKPPYPRQRRNGARYIPPPVPDYTSTAILACFLFLLGYFPGLIYAALQLVEASKYSNHYRYVYGIRPAGIGCLWTVLLVGIFGPIVVYGLLFVGLYYAFPHH